MRARARCLIRCRLASRCWASCCFRCLFRSLARGREGGAPGVSHHGTRDRTAPSASIGRPVTERCVNHLGGYGQTTECEGGVRCRGPARSRPGPRWSHCERPAAERSRANRSIADRSACGLVRAGTRQCADGGAGPPAACSAVGKTAENACSFGARGGGSHHYELLFELEQPPAEGALGELLPKPAKRSTPANEFRLQWRRHSRSGRHRRASGGVGARQLPNVTGDASPTLHRLASGTRSGPGSAGSVDGKAAAPEP